MRLITLLKTTPKTINHLSHTIGTTDRSIYRYIDLIKELGFDVQKNNTNRYFIAGEVPGTNLSFTPEEAAYLKQLILSTGKQTPLTDSILKKIQQTSEVNIVSNLTIKANLSRVIEQIAEAIHTEHQIELINYHSISSNSITNRMVEPIGFTDNYDALMAYEPETQKNKYFKIERIDKIEILDHPIKHKDKHQHQKPDPFGFAPRTDGTTITIHLKMTLKAYLLMKEEYPLTTPYFKHNKKNNTYILKLDVNNLKPITRFQEGLKEEIEYVEDIEINRELRDDVI
jgi:predicted DNA-binding transcriptional regulator YafY